MKNFPIYIKLILGLLLGLIFILIGFSCSKDEAPPTSRFTTFYDNVMKTNCRSCHIPGGEAYDRYAVRLDFSTKETAHSTLTTLNSLSPSTANCSGIPYATARDVNRSYLVAMLVDSYNNTNNYAGASCTPLNTHIDKLTQTEKDSIVSWINEGATI